MPLTELYYPILQQFFCTVERRTGMPAQPLEATAEQQARAEQLHQKQDGEDRRPKQLPKGVVLGPDGKPCRSCTSFASWAAMTKARTSNNPPSTPSTLAATASAEPPADCPPDVDLLGRSTWTFLHSLTATYPERPTPTQQSEAKQFLSLFGKFYPCWVCAEDFRNWMARQENEPRVSSREEFGRWMCEAHNAVNVKLGKEVFDCGRWDERWRTGWRDGRCD